MAKKHDVVWEPGGRIGHIVEETKTMTPDERLREAVLAYMKATRNVAILGDPEHREAFHRSHKALVDAFNCANSAANMKRDPAPASTRRSRSNGNPGGGSGDEGKKSRPDGGGGDGDPVVEAAEDENHRHARSPR